MQNSFQGEATGVDEPSTVAHVTKPNRAAKVVIVGAGLAGLAAAQRLHELGVRDVIVLDALNRVGGRVHTIDHSDYLLELGAQWLHGADENPLYQWLTEKSMLDDFEDASLSFEGLFCTTNGERMDPKLVSRVIDILVESKVSLFNRPDARIDGAKSASQVFERRIEEACDTDEELQRNRPQVRSVFDWFLRFEAVENGGTMDEVSVASYTDYTDWGDGTLLNFKRGYRSLLGWFCAQVPANQWIHLNKQVLDIEMLREATQSGSWLDDQGNRHTRPILVRYKGTEATKQSISADSIECDHVIVTVSLGFLKKNQETFFRPPLPRNKRDLINSIGFGTVNKIVLQFERPFWGDDHGLKLVWDWDESGGEFPRWVRDIISFDVVRRQPNLLIGWIGGQGARDMESETDESIADICLRLFRKFLPEDYNKPSRLVACFCSRWNSNPFTCGSYSFQSMNSFDHNVDKLHEPLYNLSPGGESNKLIASSVSRLPRVMFAGEATAGKLYSTTHGAIITGWREADRLIDSLSGSNRLSPQQIGIRNTVSVKTNQ